MPCDTPGGWVETAERDRAEIQAHKARIRELSALLCELCSAWGAPYSDGKMPPSVAAWWAEHQAQDRKRLQDAKARAARSARAKQTAITRLERQRRQIDEELAALRKGTL